MAEEILTEPVIPGKKQKVLQAQNEYVEIAYRDNILFGRYLVKHLTLDIAKCVLALQNTIDFKKPALMLIDISSVKSMNKEARNFFSSPEVMKNSSAAAVVTPTAIHKIMLNFFLNFNKPIVPTRFFSDETEAKNWLEKFKNP